MNLYESYVRKMRRIADIQHAVAVLHWDKEVNLPKGASAFRSQQIATLSSMAHEMFTEDSTGILLEKLMQSSSLDVDQKRNVELTHRDYTKEVLLPADFIEQLALAQSESFSAWIKAREANDYMVFAPALKKVVRLKREEGAMRAEGGDPYDALLDIFEPGLTGTFLDGLFSQARAQVLPLISYITAGEQSGTDFLSRFYPKNRQWEFGLDILRQLGYDFAHGRQDISEHPFSIAFSPEDVRITTRIDEYDFSNMLWSCVHEAGHALYEQGLPKEQYGLPLGAAASLAIHESQSRLWENQVARSKAFWKFQFDGLKQRFPENLGDVSSDDFHGAINHIAPNLIRTEADELHYHLHVMIRYELERNIVHGTLEVENLRELWNQKYRDYLNIEVPDDRRGILQDVHWSHGSFGYFPTYSLGSFYAAQFYDQALKDIPGLETQIGAGQYGQLKDWLHAQVYRHGRKHDPADLCRRITGRQLDLSFFVEYAMQKYGVPVQNMN